MRTVKDPAERKAELLETAMRLFSERGYDNVSMRDIARAADVAPGLAYHYFDSKQKLFAAALDAYAAECAEGVIAVLDDAELALDEKFDRLFSTADDESGYRRRSFFHGDGAEAFHAQLSLAMCERVYPHALAAVRADARARGVRLRSPETLVSFLLHGQIGIMSEQGGPSEEKLTCVREYLRVLVASQEEPA